MKTIFTSRTLRFKLALLTCFFILPFLAQAQGYIQASTFIGGGAFEQGQRVVVDNGESYIVGYTSSNNFVTTTGSGYAGNDDLFVTKLSANGTVLWSRYLGGSGSDSPKDMIVSNGSVFILGSAVNSPNYPVTNGSVGATVSAVYTKLNAATGALQFSTFLGGGTTTSAADLIVAGGYVYCTGYKGAFSVADMHVVKFDANTNNVIFDRTYGGSASDIINISPYMSGNTCQVVGNEIFIAGTSTSTNFPVTDGSTRPSASGGLIYLKLNATTGDIAFATFYGSTTGSQRGNNELRVDNGGVYIGGYTNGSDFPVTDGSTLKGFTDFFLRKYNVSDNALVYSKLLGSTQTDVSYRLEVQNGVVYMMGTLFSSQGYPHTNLPGSNYTGTSNIFYTKLNANTGAISYSTWINSNSTDDFADFQVVNGELYFVGNTYASDYPVTNGSAFKEATFNDFVFTKINSSNQICFSTYVGVSNSDDDYAYSLAVDNNFVYFTGYSYAADYPVTNSTTFKAGGDAIWTKYNLNPSLTVGSDNVTPASQTVCKNGFATVLTAPEITFPANNMPLLYINGVPTAQTPFELKYQWQQASAATGPWTDIPGATQQNYTPQIGLVNVYYRRITNSSVCGSSTPISTSSVASVLVNANTAPSVTVGNVVNTCVGSSVLLGGSPTATANGGASIVSYLWTPAGAYTPNNTVANPTITATTGTIYTVLVTDNNGCQQIGQQLVNAYAANAGPNQNNCGGQSTSIGSAPIAGLSGVTYSWSASPADPSMSCTNCAQPNVNPTGVTTYTLTLTIPITGGGTCSSTSSTTVTPIAAPVTPNFAGPDRVICIGSTASIGTAAESGFTYTWAPGNYLTANNTSTTTFQPGNLAMPIPNPGTYYLTASKGLCSFFDQMQTAVIEARAGVDGCGPRLVGMPDRTPGINETYSWTKISGPGNFSGATNLPQVPVTASVGGSTTYELTVSYTLGGSTQTCTDQVVVPDCGCVVDITVEAPFSCPAYTLNGGVGTVKLIATAADIFSADPSVFTYTWTPNVGLSAYTGREVFLTDNVNRTYTVTMSSPFDPSFACTRTIEVNRPAWSLPVFTAQDVTTCPGTSVNIGQATVAGYSYLWSGNTALLSATNISNPTATVNFTNQFPVLVTDVGSGCTVRDTATVTILGFPANIAGDDITICGSGTVQLGRDPVPNVTYVWTPATTYVPNNTVANPTVTVATTTTFTVTATNNISGCVVTDNVTVTVNPPVTPFSFVNQTFCPSTAGAIPLPAGPSGMTSYSWSPASLVVNPTSNGPTATTLATRPQTVTNYTLTVTNAQGCTAAATVTFTPSVSIPVAGDNKVICLGEAVQLGGAPEAGATYSWASNPGSGNAYFNSTSISNPTFTATAAGVYVLTVSKTNGGCTTTATVTITVNTFTLPALSNPTVCQNSCVEIGTTPALSGVQYVWSPSTGLSNPNISNPIACVTTTSRTYTLTAVAANGCVATQTVVVGVNPSSAPTVTIPTVTICLGDPAPTLNPTVSPSGTYNYLWSPNNGTLSNIYALNPTVIPTGVGTQTYTLTVTNTTTGCATTAVGIVNVNNCVVCPNAGTDGSTSVCDNSTTAIDLFSLITGEATGGVWTRTTGTGGTFNATAGTFTPAIGATTSTFTYTVTGTAPCPNDASVATVNISAYRTAGTDGSTSVCDNSTTAIDLFSLITGEATGGVWTRTTGTGGTFNAAAGTFTPAAGATNSTFTYTITGTAPCPNDDAIATVNISAFRTAGADGSTSVCDNSTTAIDLFSLITGEATGGVWTRTSGTGGTFNAAAGTFTPASGATTSTFTYTITGTAPCPNDDAIATVNISAYQTAGTDGSTSVCDNSTTAINLFSLITGEATGGVWTRTTGTGGTFNTAAGTFTRPLVLPLRPLLIPLRAAPCPNDAPTATVNISAFRTAGADDDAIDPATTAPH
ncbi:MAG: hypothetical protein U0X91_04785 [Spirosomataceae bacterium]